MTPSSHTPLCTQLVGCFLHSAVWFSHSKLGSYLLALVLFLLSILVHYYHGLLSLHSATWIIMEVGNIYITIVIIIPLPRLLVTTCLSRPVFYL